MSIRGVRGATTVSSNTKDEIIEKTKEILEILVEKNSIDIEDIASTTFSVTDELDAEFPAVAARRLGWTTTPLFCAREIPVKGSLPMCIRVLLHVNSEVPQKDIVHVYLGDAKKLRPDIDIESDNHYVTKK